MLRVIAGEAYGFRAPTRVLSPTLYVHASLAAGAELDVDEAHEERAVYVADGTIELDGQVHGEGTLLVLDQGPARITAKIAANLMLLGGAPLGPRHIFWNFVASSKERIERAKDDWRSGRFPKVPGDELEFIPLPE